MCKRSIRLTPSSTPVFWTFGGGPAFSWQGMLLTFNTRIINKTLKCSADKAKPLVIQIWFMHSHNYNLVVQMQYLHRHHMTFYSKIRGFTHRQEYDFHFLSPLQSLPLTARPHSRPLKGRRPALLNLCFCITGLHTDTWVTATWFTCALLRPARAWDRFVFLFFFALTLAAGLFILVVIILFVRAWSWC